MARTALFGLLQRSFRKARMIGQGDSARVWDMLEAARQARRVSRRDFLRRAAGTAAVVGASTMIPGCLTPGSRGVRRNAPRIAIIGGGMAGLNAAYTLKKQGLDSTIYEASGRTGGRMRSATDLLAPGLTTELGGEFLDTGHDDMFALIREFELPMLDMEDDAKAGLVEDACFFGGRHYKEAEIIEVFLPVADKMQADFDGLGETIDYQNDGKAAALDRTSIKEYLEKLGGAGFLQKLLEVAYVTEYGLDADEQSALNLLMLIGLDTSKGFSIFGESDERYKVRGGNQRVVDELAMRLDSAIEREHSLVAVRSRGSGYNLTFHRKGSASLDVDADFVVMTIPFSVLRGVEINVELPPVKRRAINELGYGTNAKLLMGFKSPVWRDRGFSGNILADQPFQLGWDNGRLQGKAQAGFTFYSGGKSGIRVGEGTPAEQVQRLLPGLSAAFPGVEAQGNGHVERFHWPSFPHSRGSYACYRPGQWTTIRGAEGESIGNLYFAGEHCSRDFQGFMNGAAETGREAAEGIVAAVRGQTSGHARILRRQLLVATK